MAILTVRKDPDPVLRKKAQEVDAAWLKSDEAQQLIDNMIETTHAENGVGLAAPQIGESIRLIVVSHNGNDEILVNPVVEPISEKKECAEEGCLSIPETWGSVERYKKVRVSGLDRRGNNLSFTAKGLHARIYQHEVDHINGVLITDKFEDE